MGRRYQRPIQMRRPDDIPGVEVAPPSEPVSLPASEPVTVGETISELVAAVKSLAEVYQATTRQQTSLQHQVIEEMRGVVVEVRQAFEALNLIQQQHQAHLDLLADEINSVDQTTQQLGMATAALIQVSNNLVAIVTEADQAETGEDEGE